MYIYNITTKVDLEIADEWLQWQKEKNIPEIMAMGYFYEYHFCQLLGHDESDGKTFTLQLCSESRDKYESFQKYSESALIEKAYSKWPNHFVYFCSLLESIS